MKIKQKIKRIKHLANNLVCKLLFGVIATVALSTNTYATNKYNLSTKEINCLAVLAYHEDRGSGKEAMLAVMHVANNRKHNPSFPNDICKVTAQPKQFSYYKHRHIIKEKEMFEEAKILAKEFSQGKYKDNTKGSLFFHSKGVNPRWNRNMHRVKTIGGHHFFKPKAKETNKF